MTSDKSLTGERMYYIEKTHLIFCPSQTSSSKLVDHKEILAQPRLIAAS